MSFKGYFLQENERRRKLLVWSGVGLESQIQVDNTKGAFACLSLLLVILQLMSEEVHKCVLHSCSHVTTKNFQK